MSPLTSHSKMSILRLVLQRTHSPAGTFAIYTRSLTTSSALFQISTPSSTLSPTPSSSDSASTKRISRETLNRLHHLSALNPPLPNSKEETNLIGELSDLISLMDQVKDVELPNTLSERSDLLAQGVGEITLSQKSIDELDQTKKVNNTRGEGILGQVRTEAEGKELLDWSTNRVGDYYASRLKKKE
ncbi:uncharacterized protein IL334_005033 [Kwoniella shivajii]|uniref:Glutamyl-tRNA(Gln) amidotransferase subunit F, mitochondrial n=1 Tax=Kwoniella shivajii TaxID=564305 RepID=A0ABZ1D271_9TREE|nr:hypothetical protein IL334_005033 [Kwoniella shivajii]